MTSRADVTVIDGYGEVVVMTYWNEAAVSEQAARAAFASEAAEYAAAHRLNVRESSLVVLSVVLS